MLLASFWLFYASLGMGAPPPTVHLPPQRIPRVTSPDRFKHRRYDREDISRLYFFPRRTAALAKTRTGSPVPLALQDHTRLGAFWSRPHPHAPTILYLYGNGETVTDQLGHWPQWAERAGANMFFVDYPGFGTSDGKPSLRGAAQAAEAALDYLLSRPPAEVPSVVVMGRSAGSLFALHAAQRKDPRIRGVILESAVADVKQRFEFRLGDHPDREKILDELAEDFDHEAKVKALSVPLLVLHTAKDTVVPSWHGTQLAKWAGTQPILFPNGDHNNIQQTNQAEYQRRLGDFIARVAK